MKLKKEKVLRVIGIFFIIMLFFTLIGSRINDIMTPEVVTTSAIQNELQININKNAVITEGNVSFTLNMEKEKLLQLGDSLDVTFLEGTTRVRAVVIDKEFNPEAQEMRYICQLMEEATTVYNGQHCQVRFAYSLGSFNRVLPRECLFYDGGEAFVYYVQAMDAVTGKQQTIQKLMVAVLEEDEFGVAVSGNISERHLIVRYATKPLKEGQRVRLGL